MKFGFVILHYKTFSDTVNCIESIVRCAGCNANIVVVDNNSNNGSYEKLKKHYSNNDCIVLIHSNANVGFAKGNNIGYKYCRSVLHSDLITCMNNDTKLEDPAFLKHIELDAMLGVDVVGPTIISKQDGKNQNPMKNFDYRYISIFIQIAHYLSVWLLYHLPDAIIKRVISWKKRVLQPKNMLDDIQESQKDRVLHGSFITFMASYVHDNSYAFYPDTFLYLEEAILFYRVIKSGGHTFYDSNIKVSHVEDSATNSATDGTREKKRFLSINMIKSYVVLLKLKLRGF